MRRSNYQGRRKSLADNSTHYKVWIVRRDGTRDPLRGMVLRPTTRPL